MSGQALQVRSTDRVADIDARIVSIARRETLVRLVLELPAEFGAVRAGQFALLKSLRAGAPLLPRPLSLCPSPDGLFIVFNVVGEGTRALAALQEGERLALIGPLGNTFAPREEPIDIVLDAPHAGTMLALAHERAMAGRADTVFLLSESAAPHPSDAPLHDALLRTGARVETVSPGAIAERLGENRHIAIGAADSAVARVQRLAAQRGLTGEVSMQAPMACGLGVCKVCVHPARDGPAFLVCDGPIFDLQKPKFATMPGGAS